VRRGAAIEARVYAEDPARGFLPSPGRIERLREPSGPYVRVDSGVREGSSVSAEYDPLLAKLCVWGADRTEALRRLRRALGEYVVLGVDTNLELLQALANDAEFSAGNYDTEFVMRRSDLHEPGALEAEREIDLVAALAALEAGEAHTRFASDDRDALSPWILIERARLR